MTYFIAARRTRSSEHGEARAETQAASKEFRVGGLDRPHG